MEIKAITNENFEELVLKSDKPVLVDFWAPWCVHCKRLNPVMDVIYKDYGDVLDVYKANVDEVQTVAASYKIMTIPALLAFKKGELVDTIIAPKSKADLENWLKEHKMI